MHKTPWSWSSLLFAVMLTLSGLAWSAPQSEVQKPEPPRTTELKFALQEHDLYPESIAHDPRSKSYFLSSLGQSRILRIEEDGTYEDFAVPTDCGLASSVGMKAHREFVYPTTGMILGDELLVVATSFANRPGRMKSLHQHPDVLIFRVPLKTD